MENIMREVGQGKMKKTQIPENIIQEKEATVKTV